MHTVALCSNCCVDLHSYFEKSQMAASSESRFLNIPINLADLISLYYFLKMH